MSLSADPVGSRSKSSKKGRRLPDRRDDPAIHRFLAGLQLIQYRRQVRRVGQEPAIVADVTILPDSCGRRRIVKVVDPTAIQQVP